MTPKRPRDVNQLAKMIVALTVKDAVEVDPAAGKSASAVARGRRGGEKGGAARRESLTPSRRSAIAKSAAAARWKRS